MAQLLSNLSVGDKVKFGTYKVESSTTEPIIWRIVAKDHTGYPNNSVTLLTDRIIDLRGVDAKEPNNANSDRQNYGNNRYRTSNLRQWLNSNGAANSWWSAQNLTDGTANTNNKDATPNDSGMNHPTGYDDIPGFLNNFTSDELSKVLNTTLTVAKNTVTDGDGSEVVTDKVFLLSNTEVGLANENNIEEGSLLAAFSNDASRISYATSQCISNTLSSSKPADTSAAWYWWLRSPNAGNASSVRSVHSSGALSHNDAYSGNYGVRPALNLESGIFISDSVDGDGCYVAILNSDPTISGEDEDLGNKSAGFTKDYTVDDEDAGDTLTIVEKVDGTVIRTINDAVRQQTYTLDLESAWASLTLDDHTATITVTDDKGGSATRTYTFKKIDDRGEQFTKPVETSIAAKRLTISGIITVPEGRELEIYACNNAYDDEPTWEDATEAWENRQAHIFQNTVKTADKWGIKLRFFSMREVDIDIEVDGFGFSFNQGGMAL